MKYQRKASKGRFALAATSAMLSCLIAGFAASSEDLLSVVLSKVSEALGYGSLEIGAVTPWVVIPLTITTVFAISRFASTTVKTWDVPVRVSETELAEKRLQNDIYALSFEQLKLIAKRQPDPIASDYVSNWEKNLAEPPKPIEAKHLLRDLFVMSKQEVGIPENGWRSEGNLWIGEIYGIKKNDVKQIVVFIFNTPPSERDLKKRVQTIKSISEVCLNSRYFALYMSEDEAVDRSGKSLIEDLNIEVLSSRQMIFQGLDLHGYARKILQMFNTTKVGGTKATLRNSFVDLKIKNGGSDATVCSLSKKLKEWSNTNSQAHLAITGEYGQGKSTALLKFCCDWAERFLEDGKITEPVPLLIELRGKSPSEVDPLGFLSTWCSRYQLNPEQVFNLIKSGEAILIFEGFDELKNSGRAFDRHQHFNALWRFAYPKVKLVFTGRPNFFLDQVESNRTLRYDKLKGAGGNAYTELWHLLKLDRGQIESACRGYEDYVRFGLMSSIETSDTFFEIVSRPSMIPVVATIWDDIEKLQEEGTPLTGAVLLELYIQAVFSRKEAELEQDRVRYDAPSGSRYLVLPKSVRELLTICVAWRMSGIGAQNTIPRTEIAAMVRDMYDSLFKITKGQGVSPEIVSGMLEFEKRYSESSRADRIEVITSEICSSGLLISDPAGGATNLRFPHKQFFEFLLAKAICITRSKVLTLCPALISCSSVEKNIFVRLSSEPNAIGYLAECSGPSTSILFGFMDTLVIRSMFILNLAELRNRQHLFKLLSFFTKTFMPKKMQLTSVDNADIRELEIFDARINNYKNLLDETMLRKLIFIIFSLILFLLSYAEIKKMFSIEDGSFVIGLIFIAIVFSIIGCIFYLFKNILHNGNGFTNREWVFIVYLRAQWSKGGQKPKTVLEIYSLAEKSLANKHVEFPTKIKEPKIDFNQFLYPAEKFEG